MPDKNVQMPDGSVVAFPDSMSDDAIASVLKAQHPAAKAPDTRNDIQKSFDENTKVDPADSLLQRGLKDVVGAAGAPFIHPLNSIAGLLPQDFATQYQQAQANPNKPTLAQGVVDAAGQGFGSLAAGTAMGAGVAGAKAVSPMVGDAASSVLTTTGENLKSRAVKGINKTVGGTQADFDRGANMGRGYLANDLGTSSSMQSVADKAVAAQEHVGKTLNAIYKDATESGHLIPVSKVEAALNSPLDKAYDLETGVGGTGNTGSLDNYSSAIKKSIAIAKSKGGFTPSELFDIKQRIKDQTNWGDATQKSLNGVRQQQVGAISGVLGDELPATKALNQSYGDLENLAERAQHRSNTGSRPLTDMVGRGAAQTAGAAMGATFGPAGAAAGSTLGGIVTSIPVRTGAATVINRLGRSLVKAGGKLGSGADSAPAVGIGVIPEKEIPNPTQYIGNGQTDNDASKQGIPPAAELKTTPSQAKGQALWQELGAAKLRDHINRDTASEVSASDLDALQKSPQGKSLLIQASDLKPGSPAMKEIVKRIESLIR